MLKKTLLVILNLLSLLTIIGITFIISNEASIMFRLNDDHSSSFYYSTVTMPLYFIFIAGILFYYSVIRIKKDNKILKIYLSLLIFIFYALAIFSGVLFLVCILTYVFQGSCLFSLFFLIFSIYMIIRLKRIEAELIY